MQEICLALGGGKLTHLWHHLRRTKPRKHNSKRHTRKERKGERGRRRRWKKIKGKKRR
jgi:hypothetical protein